MNIKKLFKLILIAVISAGSVSVNAQQNTQDKSASEIQSIQTRTYDKPYKDVFRAVVSVLQDNKYKVSQSDFNSGLITASGTPQVSENMNKAVGFIPFVGGLLSMAREQKIETWYVSGTIEDLKKDMTKVRLVITADSSTSNIVSSAADASKSDDMTSNPQVYQDLFAKIDQALFLRGATK